MYYPNLMYPLSNSGGGGGGSYTLPVATSTVLGGIMADTAVSSDTQEVRINGNKLYTAAQVQSDWAITDITATDYIKNKPSIPDISNKQDKATIVEDTVSTDITVTLADNTEYYYGTLASLSVSLPASGKYQAWVRFTSGAAATTCVFTGFAGWAGGSAPTISASKTYEISVKDGYGTCQEF